MAKQGAFSNGFSIAYDAKSGVTASAGDYTVSYGGFPVHLEEPSYDLHYWLERALSIPGSDLFAGEPLGVLPTEATWGCPVDSTLERTNWPKKDPPLLNSLQWPVTGATRFARSAWLFSGDDWDEIKAKLDESDPRLTLKFYEAQSDAWAGTREIEMYALRPRRVPPLDVGIPVLWIVPLVDVRYLWQFRPVKLTCDKDTTWTGLLDQVNNELRTSVIYRESVSDFGNPDPRTWDNRVEPAGILLDAIAGSLGRRFVATTEGSHSIVTADVSASDSAGWPIPENERPRLAGDDNDHSGFVYPEKLWVVFPPYESGNPTNKAPKVVETDLSQWASGTFWTDTGSAHLIRSTYYADVDPDNPDDPSQNLTALTSLAEQLGEAVAKWLALEYEYSFHGHAEHWIGCGFDDTITIEFGTLNPISVETRLMPGNYRSRTRIKSLPPNCLPTMNYSQEPAKDLNECLGGAAGGGTLYGFELVEDLSYSDPYKLGNITEVWLGDTPNISADVFLLNPDAMVANTYIFAGDAFRKGLCVLANIEQWIPPHTPPSYTIIQMECSDCCAGSIADGQVKIDSAGNSYYLESVWADTNTYDQSLHTRVFFENTGSDSIRAFFDNTSAGKDEQVSIVGGDTPGYLADKLTPILTSIAPIEVKFRNDGSTMSAFFEQGDLPPNTDERVKTSIADPLAGYLMDKFLDQGIYDPAQHEIVFFQEITATMRAFVAKHPPDRLVAADASDVSPGTLDAKIANPLAYNPTNHQIVYQEVAGATIQLFTDKGQVSGNTDELVKASAADPVAGYLIDKFSDQGAFTGVDIPVLFTLVGDSAVRGFLRPADLPPDSDEFVKVSATDTAAYLGSQFAPMGSPVVGSVTVSFDNNGDVISGWIDPANLPPDSDEFVKVSATDTAAYLGSQFTPMGSPVVGSVTVSFDNSGDVISGWIDPADLPSSQDRLVAVGVGDTPGTLDAKLTPYDTQGINDPQVYFKNDTTAVSAFVKASELPLNTDEKVSVRFGDAANYLENQFLPIIATPGNAILVKFDSTGSVMTAWIDPADTPAGSDELVSVSSGDIAGYLEDQLSPLGSPIIGVSNVTFNSSGTLITAWADSIVKVDASDVSPGYLDTKFTPAGAWTGLMINVRWDVLGDQMIAFVDPTDLPSGSDELVSVRNGDTPGYLEDKVSPVQTPTNPVQVKFESSGTIVTAYVETADLPAGGDRLVAASSADGTPGELDKKLSPFSSPASNGLTVHFQNPVSGTITASWSAAEYGSFDASAGSDQYLGNIDGSVSWQGRDWITLSEMVQITYLTDVDWNPLGDGSLGFAKRTRTAWVVAPGPESSWAEWEPGTTCVAAQSLEDLVGELVDAELRKRGIT